MGIYFLDDIKGIKVHKINKDGEDNILVFETNKYSYDIIDELNKFNTIDYTFSVNQACWTSYELNDDVFYMWRTVKRQEIVDFIMLHNTSQNYRNF